MNLPAQERNVVMRIQCSNNEPDGRMFVTGQFGLIYIVPTWAIDELAQAIQEHCGSEGDSRPFEIDFETGKVKLI